MKSPDGSRLPAPAVAGWYKTRWKNTGCPDTRLFAAGYDMDNMKARSFVESEMPLPAAREEDEQSKLEELASSLVLSAEQTAKLLRSAIHNALFISKDATVKLDTSMLNAARERLWEETELTFFQNLKNAATISGDIPDSLRRGWLAHLREIALRLFDEAAPLSADLGGTAAPRVGKARRDLGFALAGYTPEGAELFSTLGLPPAEQKETKKNKGKRKVP